MKSVKPEQKPKNRKNLFIITGIVLILIIISLIYYFGFYNKQETFSANTILLKLNIPLGGELDQNVKITNNYGKEQKFNVYLDNFDNIASINENEFSIGPGDSKDIIISFKDVNSKIEVYSGNLIIKTSNFKKEIPVIIGTEDKNNYFAITQKILSEDISPGGKIRMEVRIFNLVDKEIHNIEFSYVIKNFNNDVLIADNENLAVKDSTSMIKLIDLPKNTKYGKYIFITSITYDHSQAMASSFFEISKKQAVYFSSENSVYYLVLVVLIFIFGTVIFFFYFIRSRNQISCLKRQQEKELQENLEVIKKYEEELKKQKEREELRKKREKEEEEKQKVLDEINRKRVRTRKFNKFKEKLLEFMGKFGKRELPERKLKEQIEEKSGLVLNIKTKLKELNLKKNKIIASLKKKHKKQLEEVKELKKEEKKEEIKEKIDEWKTEGEEMVEIQKELKIPQTKIKKILEKKGENVEKEFMKKFYSGLRNNKTKF